MNRRADVVHEPRQRYLRGTHSAADLAGGFDEQHRKLSLRQINRRCQTVRTGTDYYRIVEIIFHACLRPSKILMRPLRTGGVFQKMMTKLFPFAALHAEI